MGYVVLDANWNITIIGGTIKYYISEIAAVKIDEKIHSVDTFRLMKKSDGGYLKSELHFDKDEKIIVGDDVDGWLEFSEWIDHEDTILVWDKDINQLFKYMNREFGGGVKLKKIVHMEDLYMAMTSSIRTDIPKYATAMKEMELLCDASMLRYPAYKTGNMVKLFRKLRTVGIKTMGNIFDEHVRGSHFNAIKRIQFFPRLDRAEARTKSKEVQNIMNEYGIEAKVTGSIVKFETSHANFVFNYESKDGKLTYTSKSYYKGLRYGFITTSNDQSVRLVIDLYVAKAKEIDGQLARGVGSKEVSDILNKLCV